MERRMGTNGLPKASQALLLTLPHTHLMEHANEVTQGEPPVADQACREGWRWRAGYGGEGARAEHMDPGWRS